VLGFCGIGEGGFRCGRGALSGTHYDFPLPFQVDGENRELGGEASLR